jgi:hypothetical protein
VGRLRWLQKRLGWILWLSASLIAEDIRTNGWFSQLLYCTCSSCDGRYRLSCRSVVNFCQWLL